MADRKGVTSPKGYATYNNCTWHIPCLHFYRPRLFKFMKEAANESLRIQWRKRVKRESYQIPTRPKRCGLRKFEI